MLDRVYTIYNDSSALNRWRCGWQLRLRREPLSSCFSPQSVLTAAISGGTTSYRRQVGEQLRGTIHELCPGVAGERVPEETKDVKAGGLS